MTRHIALLRGINLGSHRRVDMKQLRAILEGAGYADARTHLQSGNVVLSSDTPPDRLAAELESLLEAELGGPVQVVARTRDELADVIARDPLRDIVDNPRRYQVSFLSAELDPSIAGELAEADFGPERVAVSGREIYAWHPNGIHDSPLAKRLTDKRLGGVVATARNWNTVTKLLELAGQ